MCKTRRSNVLSRPCCVGDIELESTLGTTARALAALAHDARVAERAGGGPPIRVRTDPGAVVINIERKGGEEEDARP